MKIWNELRVVYLLGRHSTVSEAANVLGMHRATFIRHLDKVEHELGQKLFLRHQKGYTPTDAGKELMQIVSSANEQIDKSIGMLKSKSSILTGELTISAPAPAFAFLATPLKAFLIEHPNITLNYQASYQKSRLEYGEAHIAVWPGEQPDHPDYVVQPFHQVKLALYASKSYRARFGLPSNEKEFDKHYFVATDLEIVKDIKAWQDRTIPKDRIILNCIEPNILEDAIKSGIGIGLLRVNEAVCHSDLIEVMPNREVLTFPVWLVTHGDQHRSPKVQACLKHLKEWAADNT